MTHKYPAEKTPFQPLFWYLFITMAVPLLNGYGTGYDEGFARYAAVTMALPLAVTLAVAGIIHMACLIKRKRREEKK